MTLSLVIRPATAADAACLSVLAMQVFLDTYALNGIRPAIAREVLSTYSESQFSSAIGRSGTCIRVAEFAGHIVGFAQVTLGVTHELAPRGAQSELLRLYVQEPFTRKGVGTRLLFEAEGLAFAANSRVLWLTPWVHNERALHFYRHHGYKDFGLTYFTAEGESHENRVYAKPLTSIASAG